MNKLDKIRELYKEIPAIDCKGLCAEYCFGPLPMTEEERKLLKSKGFTGDGSDGKCSMLGMDNRCMAYNERPAICRLWGNVPPCPWGCEPKGGHWTTERAQMLWQRIQRIAGER